MTDGSGTPSCFLFHHQYDVNDPNHDTSRFTIHYTLEKGAEVYYSGVRVIVIAKKIVYDDKFVKVKIRQVVWVGGKRVEIEPPKDTNEVIDDHAPSVDGLPLYNIILELVDLSDAFWSHAEIRFQTVAESSNPGPIQIPNTHKVLYDHAKRTTVHSRSCVLLLATRDIDLRRPLKQGIASGHKSAYHARIGLPTHGFRILPPSERRPFFFTQPPPEILHHIFSIIARRGRGYHNGGWRRSLFAASLVCRAWWEVALCIIYEDFGSRLRGKLHIGRLANTLEDNPTWGKHIKRFSLYCFTGWDTGTQSRRDALTILKTATNIRRLSVGNVTAVLAEEFIQTFCKMAELREFTQFLTSPLRQDADEKTYLNATQLTKCFVYWPKLRQASVYKFGQPFAEDGDQFASAPCALDQITFGNGIVSIAHLRAITASSRDTLHIVALRYIEGISNEELTSWLVDFGPNLTNLTLECNNVFTHSEADELALDATIHMMPKLSCLNITGPVATALTLLRFEPTQGLEGRIYILCPVLFDLYAVVKALRTTKWKIVDAGIPDGGPAELIEEAERVAKERGIDLRMR